jgi:hypothetical protein
MPKKKAKHDNFLADAIIDRDQRVLGYLDGFRFGVGFFVAGVLLSLILGVLTWGLVAALRLS